MQYSSFKKIRAERVFFFWLVYKEAQFYLSTTRGNTPFLLCHNDVSLTAYNCLKWENLILESASLVAVASNGHITVLRKRNSLRNVNDIRHEKQ